MLYISSKEHNVINLCSTYKQELHVSMNVVSKPLTGFILGNKDKWELRKRGITLEVLSRAFYKRHNISPTERPSADSSIPHLYFISWGYNQIMLHKR